jgi:hypothetical protein
MVRVVLPDPDPYFSPIPDPGVKKAPNPGSATLRPYTTCTVPAFKKPGPIAGSALQIKCGLEAVISATEVRG